MTKTKGRKHKNKVSSEQDDSTTNITVKEVKLAKADNQISNSEDVAINNTNRENTKKRKRNASENAKSDNLPTEEAQESGENRKKSKKKKNKAKSDTDKDGTVPESQMSKRKLKREKHEQRLAEAEEASHKAVQMQALSYLSLWKYNKAEWKFNKVKQIWLYKHKFESDKIPDELWQPYIEYFSAATGGIKQMLLNDCQKIIEEMDKWMEKNEESGNEKSKPSETGYRRARDLLQNIHN